MSTLILYISQHGAAEKSSDILKTKLKDTPVDVKNLRKDVFNPENYENIILGCSIHAGHVQGKMKKFVKKNENLLGRKKVGLFITCMEEGAESQQYFTKNFDVTFLNKLKTKALFGGEFNFERMNFLEKAIIKKISGFTETVSHIDENKIENFAREFEG
ncbi:MAG: flavodoxin [Candidatus Marinimicrobia bacterium]|nr:flavodoxin [Candidatus Neomarinimicrobiota bacterium]